MFFPFLAKHWCRAIESRGGTTHAESVAWYQQYIQAKGPNWIHWGDPLQPPLPIVSRDQNALKKTEEIRQLILSGVRRTVLLARFPTMYQTISKLMELRPVRTHDTDCLYIWGPTGTGKTTAVNQILSTIQKIYPTMCFYATKYFDGYDNQPIVWMDDPCPVENRTQETATIFKNIVGSTGPCQCEIKFGSMQFDSHLIVITTNVPPDVMAESFGQFSNQAMMRRFTEPMKDIRVDSRELAIKLKKYLIQVIKVLAKDRFDIDIDVEYVLSKLPRVEKSVYPVF